MIGTSAMYEYAATAIGPIIAVCCNFPARKMEVGPSAPPMMDTKETKDVLSGKYGATVKPFNEEVKKKVLGDDAEIITCRPADLIPAELDTLRKECAQWIQQDEDVLTYALFPQVAVDFFKYREAQQTKIDPNAADTENGSYPV